MQALCVDTRDGTRLVDEVSLTVAPGEIVGLVGESGSGKSMTAYAALGLFPTRQVRITSGQVMVEGRSVAGLTAREWRHLRGARIGMVFQDPSSFLDPLLSVGRQIAEALVVHGQGRDQVARVRSLLDQVELPASIAARYPHELSGGQKQRVMIAAALAMRPALLIADEPTTALDVSVQAGILRLIRRLCTEMDLAVLLITHDFGVIREVCDRTFVMYAGQIVEARDTAALFRAPRHPYTQGLMASLLDPHRKPAALFSIPGTAAMAQALPSGCRFHPRCPLALPDPCMSQAPPLLPHEDGGADRCWRSAEPQARPAWS